MRGDRQREAQRHERDRQHRREDAGAATAPADRQGAASRDAVAGLVLDVLDDLADEVDPAREHPGHDAGPRSPDGQSAIPERQSGDGGDRDVARESQGLEERRVDRQDDERRDADEQGGAAHERGRHHADEHPHRGYEMRRLATDTPRCHGALARWPVHPIGRDVAQIVHDVAGGAEPDGRERGVAEQPRHRHRAEGDPAPCQHAGGGDEQVARPDQPQQVSHLRTPS